jgi:hypothetical protein
MSDPSLPLQKALIDTLKPVDALPSVVGGRVYDDVAASATFPYVTFGPTQVLSDKAGCFDGTEVFQQIDVWSRSVGFPECKTIAQAVVAKLDDAELIVEGFAVIVFEHQDTRYLRDPDGLTKHAAITFRSLLQPT